MKMRKELNNKGFSLVELMIATVILGIVVAPLVHTFVTAVNTTARSRQLGDATLLGENVAEAVEATPLDNLEDLFADSCFTGAQNTSFNRDTGTGVYSLSAEGVRSGGSTFNVKVTLDPRVYRTGDPENKGINDIGMIDYSSMDFVYAQNRETFDPDDLAWAEFKSRADGRHPQGGWDQSSAEPVRTMTLKVTQDAAGTIKAILTLKYSYSYLYTVTDESGSIDTYTNTISVTLPPYDLLTQGYSTASGRLPNIYLMYYPLYESGGIPNDIIRIENDAALPFKLFLVKERDSILSSDHPERHTGEPNYKATVEQYVPARTPSSNYAVLYSNIKENLAIRKDLNVDPEDTYLSGVTYRVYRGNYFSSNGYFGGEHGDLVSKTARNRLFETTVNVFAASDTTFSDPIHTFRSTKLQ